MHRRRGALVDLAIDRVRSVTGAVAVNLHHDREAIAAHLDGRVHLSVEDDEALGTAGALGHLRPWVDGRAVVVVNADTWCGDLPLDVLVDGWDGERVRLALAGDDELLPTSKVAAALMPWPVGRPLRAVPTGLYEVSWRHLAADGRIDVVRWPGPCLDCGTPARYLHANLAASGGATVVEPGASVHGNAERSVVGRVPRSALASTWRPPSDAHPHRPRPLVRRVAAPVTGTVRVGAGLAGN